MTSIPKLLPPASKPFDVVGFGQNSLDIVALVSRHPQPDSSAPVEALLRLPGGEIATAAVACARLGCRTRYIGSVGRPPDGADVVAALQREGIDVSRVRHVDAANRAALILVDRDGRRTVLWYRDSKLAVRAEEVDIPAVSSGRVLLVDAIDPAASAAATSAARQAGIATVIDIDEVREGIDALLRNIDVVIAAGSFPAKHTGASTTGEGLRRLAAESDAWLVVATLGQEGSLALHDGREIRTPAFRVPVVDSTGAGDAFRGGFVAAWLRYGDSQPVESILRYATAVAGLNCGAVGAQAGLPRWDDVDVLLTGTNNVRSK